MAAYPYPYAGALDVCHVCKGLWFDADELRKVEDTPIEWVPTLNPLRA